MDKQTILDLILTQKSLARCMAHFESSYQTFLGMLSGKTSFDQKEATDKVVRMDKNVDPDVGLAYILQSAESADTLQDILEHLQKIAAHTALQDLLDWDDELACKDQFEISVQQQIDSGSCFSSQFQEICQSGIKDRLEAWHEVFSDELVGMIRMRFENDQFSVEMMLSGNL